MNWITNLINKNLPSKNQMKEIPDNLWTKCPSCSGLVFRKDLIKNNFVCTLCDYHLFCPVENRLQNLFDNGEFIKIKFSEVMEDPLNFKDKIKYSDRIKSYREKTQQKDAIISGYGKINGAYCVVAAMNFEFMGGSMGIGVGEGFVASVNQAIKRKVPFVIVTASGGARMQEGMFSLMQMAKTTVAVEQLKESGLPYIVILANPTTGGVTASFAMLGDIHIAEQKATIAFAGARVIEQTIREKLPEGFQTAEYLLEHGMVDIVTHRHNLKEKLGTILNILSKKEEYA